MHIILVSNHLATARTLTVTPGRLAAFAASFVLFTFLLSFVFSWVGVAFNMPFAAELVAAVQAVQNRKTEEYVRDNVNSMAVRLGEMQAQLMQLDSVSERVAKLSGVSVPKKDSTKKDGAGGPLVIPSKPLSPEELRREVERLAELIEWRADALMATESQLMEKKIKSTLLPTILPIEVERVGSTFGRRYDPINGSLAMHEGIDFPADPGTRVVASAGGIVLSAEYHPQYGNLIEIDHGNEFSSRYAHLAGMNVKAGQLIKRGQVIGASGNTGRSTGPHLHFEVRFRGAPQNPARFLQMGGQFAMAGEAEDEAPVTQPGISGLPVGSRVVLRGRSTR